MKNKLTSWLLLITCLIGLTTCIREEKYANDPIGNFNQLWKIIDEKYCFLDYKGIDWNGLRNEYSRYITKDTDDSDLYNILNDMLRQLKDGHVNLTSNENHSNYDFWLDYPRNFNESLLNNSCYLGYDYLEAAGFKYTILNDNIGYIYYEKFSSSIDNTELDKIFTYFSNCKGLIIDVRQNGGGNATNSARFASRFTNEKILTGYIRHKTGPGHSDFSNPFAIYLEPSKNILWLRKVAVLTNRHSYSATNDFVNHMRCLPNVVIVGDTTGGGSGMPFTSELPNGWTLRFSASPHFDRQMNHIEWGIAPDVKIDMEQGSEDAGIDDIIEKARELLK